MNTEKFFVMASGELCRMGPGPGYNPVTVRATFAQHYRHIENGSQLRATLRAGGFAWPGGYDLFFVTSDGAALCYSCVRDNLYSVLHSIRAEIDDGWRVVGLECVANVDDAGHCDHCGASLAPDLADLGE